MTQFFDYETEGEITNKKDTIELKNWTNHLEYITKELEQLSALIKKYSDDTALLKQASKQQQENSEELSSLYNYAPSIADSQECDDVACDIFYLNKHEEFRNRYLTYLTRYRAFKSDVFTALLK